MREARQNDQIILDELRNLQKDISRIDINLALNTQETSRLAKYQEMMNGRIAGHESRMQVVEGAQAITTTAVAQIQANKSHWTDYLIKGCIYVGLALFYYVLIKNGFPNFLN